MRIRTAIYSRNTQSTLRRKTLSIALLLFFYQATDQKNASLKKNVRQIIHGVKPGNDKWARSFFSLQIFVSATAKSKYFQLSLRGTSLGSAPSVRLRVMSVS